MMMMMARRISLALFVASIVAKGGHAISPVQSHSNLVSLHGGASAQRPTKGPPPLKKAVQKNAKKAVTKATKAVKNKQDVVNKAPKTTATKIGAKQSGASIPNEVFNLIKGIVGVGVLSLPAGVAAFGNAPAAVLPAFVLISVIGALSAYGFALIGRVCAYTGATSYREAWGRSMGDKTSWIPAWSATLMTFGACLAYSMVLADTFAALLGTNRHPTLVAVTTAVLLPLCLLKNLKSLAPFSLLGVMGMAYTAIAMAIRFLDGSYAMPNGPLAQSVAENLQPLFGDRGLSSVFSADSLILVCMLSTAYMAHFNAPKFYLELQNNTLSRYNQVVSWSFGISILLTALMTLLGFLTFGQSCAGLVLNNYSTNDLWMSGSRIAVAVSLVFSYPLAFVGFRDGMLDLLNVPPAKRTRRNVDNLTIVLLCGVTFLAAILKDVSFVLALSGATLGNALTYVYPALMYRSVVKQQKRTDENVGVAIALSSGVLGIVMGIIGATMAIKGTGSS